jgi:hypothetical protein
MLIKTYCTILMLTMIFIGCNQKESSEDGDDTNTEDPDEPDDTGPEDSEEVTPLDPVDPSSDLLDKIALDLSKYSSFGYGPASDGANLIESKVLYALDSEGKSTEVAFAREQSDKIRIQKIYMTPKRIIFIPNRRVTRNGSECNLISLDKVDGSIFCIPFVRLDYEGEFQTDTTGDLIYFRGMNYQSFTGYTQLFRLDYRGEHPTVELIYEDAGHVEKVRVSNLGDAVYSYSPYVNRQGRITNTKGGFQPIGPTDYVKCLGSDISGNFYIYDKDTKNIFRWMKTAKRFTREEFIADMSAVSDFGEKYCHNTKNSKGYIYFIDMKAAKIAEVDVVAKTLRNVDLSNEFTSFDKVSVDIDSDRLIILGNMTEGKRLRIYSGGGATKDPSVPVEFEILDVEFKGGKANYLAKSGTDLIREFFEEKADGTNRKKLAINTIEGLVDIK